MVDRAHGIEGMITVLEGIGSLPGALLTRLAHDLWWRYRRQRAACSGTSKTWEKMRVSAGHTYPNSSVCGIRSRGNVATSRQGNSGIVGVIVLGSDSGREHVSAIRMRCTRWGPYEAAAPARS